MPVMFKGELTRHILKCYPAGKAQDKQPVPNELSMLIFYLQSRPGKIPKAAAMLSHRANTFSSKDNLGNLGVTALIVNRIVLELHAHFSLFAEHTLVVINCIVDKSQSDPYFLELATDLFANFNRYHNGVLFAGNGSFSEMFLNVTSKFVSIAQNGNQGARILAIKAVSSLSESPALATKVGQTALMRGVVAYQANFPQDVPTYVDATKADLSEPGPDSKKADLGYTTVIGFRHVLNTTSLDQISGVVRRMLSWLIKSGSESWQRELIPFLARWVPPQNRFIITKTVVSAMSALPTEEVDKMIIYSRYLDALLTAEESKIGLSVVDVLRQLLHLQHQLIDRPPPQAENSRIQQVLVSLRQNIANLVSTNIYPGQANDMIVEVLAKYTVSTSGSAAPVTSQSLGRGTTTDSTNQSDSFPSPSLSSASSSKSNGVLVNDFRVLLEILQSDSVQEQRKLSVPLWSTTQWILTSQHPQVLVLYAEAFTKFLENAQPNAHESTKQGSIIVRQLCNLVRRELSPINYIAAYYCMLSLISFHASSAQFLVPWILEILSADNAEISEPAKICRSSVGLAALLAVLRTLKLEETGARVFDVIGRRVERQQWLPGITFPPAVTVESAISGLTNEAQVQFATGFAVQNQEEQGEIAQLLLQELKNSQRVHSKDLEFIVAPPFAIDSPGELEEIRITKASRTNTSDQFHGSTLRSFSGISHTSSVAESQAPKVVDLRKRQADLKSLKNMKSSALPNREKRISLPPKKDSVNMSKPSDLDFMTIIDRVGVNTNTNNRGNLTT